MKRKTVSIVVLFLFVISFMIPVAAHARRGCCSHHGGVCGNQCCDGTPLSAKCGGSSSSYTPPSSRSSSGSYSRPGSSSRSSATYSRPYKPASDPDQLRKTLLSNSTGFCPADLKTHIVTHYKSVYDGMQFCKRNGAKIAPKSVKSIYLSLVEDIRNNRLDSGSCKAFGTLASIFTATIYPGFSCKYLGITPQQVKYDGYQRINDIEARIAQFQDYNYSCSNRETKDYKTLVKEVSYLYNFAFNEILDLWLTAWEDAGRDVTKRHADGTVMKVAVSTK